jgi:hypothetical protein
MNTTYSVSPDAAATYAGKASPAAQIGQQSAIFMSAVIISIAATALTGSCDKNSDPADAAETYGSFDGNIAGTLVDGTSIGYDSIGVEFDVVEKQPLPLVLRAKIPDDKKIVMKLPIPDDKDLQSIKEIFRLEIESDAKLALGWLVVYKGDYVRSIEKIETSENAGTRFIYANKDVDVIGATKSIQFNCHFKQGWNIMIDIDGNRDNDITIWETKKVSLNNLIMTVPNYL